MAEDVATEVAAGVAAMPAEVAAVAVGTATDSDAVHAAKASADTDQVCHGGPA